LNPTGAAADDKTTVATGKLSPNFITGIVVGDGCFTFSITKSASHKLGKQVQFKFSVVAADNPANIVMLQKIKEFFWK
jgi:hypothetical protein